jgi:hypothetical protein
MLSFSYAFPRGQGWPARPGGRGRDGEPVVIEDGNLEGALPLGPAALEGGAGAGAHGEAVHGDEALLRQRRNAVSNCAALGVAAFVDDGG